MHGCRDMQNLHSVAAECRLMPIVVSISNGGSVWGYLAAVFYTFDIDSNWSLLHTFRVQLCCTGNVWRGCGCMDTAVSLPYICITPLAEYRTVSWFQIRKTVNIYSQWNRCVMLRDAFHSLSLLQCFDTVGWVIWPLKTSSPKWPKLCRVGR